MRRGQAGITDKKDLCGAPHKRSAPNIPVDYFSDVISSCKVWFGSVHLSGEMAEKNHPEGAAELLRPIYKSIIERRPLTLHRYVRVCGSSISAPDPYPMMLTRTRGGRSIVLRPIGPTAQ